MSSAEITNHNFRHAPTSVFKSLIRFCILLSILPRCDTRVRNSLSKRFDDAVVSSSITILARMHNWVDSRFKDSVSTVALNGNINENFPESS